jgi:hypothetical protein
MTYAFHREKCCRVCLGCFHTASTLRQPTGQTLGRTAKNGTEKNARFAIRQRISKFTTEPMKTLDVKSQATLFRFAILAMIFFTKAKSLHHIATKKDCLS